MSRNKDVEDGEWSPTIRRSKRIRLSYSRKAEVGTSDRLSTPPTKDIFTATFSETALPEIDDFDAFFPLKDSWISARQNYLRDNSERDRYNHQIRMLTPAEIHELEKWLENCIATGKQGWTSGKAILYRRLQLRKVKKENPVFSYDMLRQPPPRTKDLEPFATIPTSEPNKETVDALYAIHRTPYQSSFASRISGNIEPLGRILHSDWQTRTVWMDVMDDIKLHYALSQSVYSFKPNDSPQDVHSLERSSPIDYVTLEPWHLPQIHELLTRTFWPGIDVTSSLEYSPEQCTVVALYKRLVVGAAFLSSPIETYLTYLVVRSGWECSGVASTILYLLLNANPTKDVTLHVSANNPAMLLYNKFGFKAEEFVVGFYDKYLPEESQTCKNAFRLRLRR